MSKSNTGLKMKTLLLMRHSKSSWKHPDLYDHERPLNKRGERDAPAMGAFLKKSALIPDVILASTAVRAQATAEAVAAACGFDGKMKFVENLYGGTVADYLHVASKAPASADRVLLIGHNPTCEELVVDVARQAEKMPTSAIVEIRIPISKWSKLSIGTQGEVATVWRPKELK